MIVIRLVNWLFEIYWWILIARFLLTWLPNVDYYNPIVQFLYRATEPVIRPFRGLIRFGQVDFSPILVFLALQLLRPLVLRLLIQLLL